MRIAIASDLHLEHADLDLINADPAADVLVLAGDILNAQDLWDHQPPDVPYPPEIIKTLGRRQAAAQRYRDFIQRVSTEFKHVVAIAGNHEFYHGKWVDGIRVLRQEYGRYTNVHYLERDIVTIDGVLFVGGTLWTDLNRGDPMTLHAIRDMMNDYATIRHDELGFTKLRPAHTLVRHRETVEYFAHILRENRSTKTVVVGHHAPSSLSIHDAYKRDTIMNGGYHSDLSELILDNPQIALWCHGHMHNDSDYTIGDTRVVCNPRGYVGFERGTQDEDPYYVKIVDIG